MTERTRVNVRPIITVVGSLVIAITLPNTAGAQASPYAGMESRETKALSDEQRVAYERGDGMGLALAAELNGLPGPKHVLELADSMDLSAEQRARTEALFESMRTAAIELGAAIIAAEERLDQWFRSGSTDRQVLQVLTTEIGALQGDLRYTHLTAHLTMRDILTREQMGRYGELRGYTADRPTPHRHEH